MTGQLDLIPATIASAFVMGMVLALLGSIKLPLAKRLVIDEARVGGLVVAKVTLHVRDGVAGIYGVATRTEARRLGLGRHLTALAADAARSLDCELVVLHSTPMAVDLYRSIGFEHAADFYLYAPPDRLHL